MPTSTFFHLPEEKRRKIIFAIKDEFSRVPFNEVSINKIVHAAKIPRGSFYQYFADKNDMLGFILSEYQKQMFEYIKTSLRASDGNLFVMFRDILDFTIDFATGEKTNVFCKNLFADIKVNSNFYLQMTKNASEDNLFAELKACINQETLDLRDEDDFTNMLDTLLAVSMDATAKVFLDFSAKEKTKQKYRNQLELLKRGFMKNKE